MIVYGEGRRDAISDYLNSPPQNRKIDLKLTYHYINI